MKKYVFTSICSVSALAAAISGCGASKTAATTPPTEIQDSASDHVADLRPLQGTEISAPRPQNYLPKALIYKTNGDYADKVPVNMSADRSSFVSFPAPSDIRKTSTPIPLADGFLLDRRGISSSTVFLDITYKEYSELKSTPSISELRKMIIPGARVTEIVRLPYTLHEAVGNIEGVDSLINRQLPGCEILLRPASKP